MPLARSRWWFLVPRSASPELLLLAHPRQGAERAAKTPSEAESYGLKSGPADVDGATRSAAGAQPNFKTAAAPADTETASRSWEPWAPWSSPLGWRYPSPAVGGRPRILPRFFGRSF